MPANRTIHVGLSLMLEPDFLAASLPLFDSESVDVIEWSPNIGWSVQELPQWAAALLSHYSENDRLLGHGVQFSPMSCVWTPADDRWLTFFDRELSERKFLQFSEHFGFSRSPQFVDGAPLPVPFTPESLKAGRNKLQMLAEFAGAIPIGLENLALAFSRVDVDQQGVFLDQLLEPINGYVVLDLHNLYCQLMNFNLEPETLLAFYPLERVREMHVSGGSWSGSTSHNKQIRRDTHDDAVPEEVFELLALALDKCPNVQAVILERLGGTMNKQEAQVQFGRDFRQVREIVDRALSSSASHSYKLPSLAASPFLTDTTRKYQERLMQLLDSSISASEIVSKLQTEFGDEDLAEYAAELQPDMIEVGQLLMTKWSVPAGDAKP